MSCLVVLPSVRFGLIRHPMKGLRKRSDSVALTLQADGASTVQDPGMIKVMSCAKFMALLEQLAVRVNAVRAIGSGKKRAASQGAKARRRGVGMSGAR